ncbi:hypothetical protein LTS18_015049, partial [Coniosporium uncinatum]
QNLDLDAGDSHYVRILSHALPLPSATGHCFPAVVNSIHEEIAPKPTVIQLFHAVPGRLTLSDIPASPPTTPGPAIGGDDYFTSKQFDSAVPVTDYQADTLVLPPGTKPAVPPSSVNVSVVERYIPPTSPNEFAGMFSITRRSLLRDRLVELSPDNGTLMLVYPTRTGGRTFMDEYLGPILDPLLRSMVVIHGLSANLSSTLGPMKAVDEMLEYDKMQMKLEQT